MSRVLVLAIAATLVGVVALTAIPMGFSPPDAHDLDGPTPSLTAPPPADMLSSTHHSVAPLCRSPIKAELHAPRAGDAPQCCRAVRNDIDRGLTLLHHISRLLCHVKGGDIRKVSVIQIGANSGDNANDHLVHLLLKWPVEALLVEPVPWLFSQLSRTYSQHLDRIHLLQAAVSEQDGTVSFVAPKPSAKGWLRQMGGIGLPPKSGRAVAKLHAANSFERINVTSVTFASLLNMSGLQGVAHSPPDVLVVDTEGYDARIVLMAVRVIEEAYHGKQRIPILQYEWKHLSNSVQEELHHRLEELRYCIVRVHYDDIAYQPIDNLLCEVGYPM